MTSNTKTAFNTMRADFFFKVLIFGLSLLKMLFPALWIRSQSVVVVCKQRENKCMSYKEICS